jgi:CMP-N-acetylneuraminic acid synthetase
MKVACLIPARKGSKEIPNKNFKEFCGKSLWEITTQTALDSGVFDKVFVSSDYEEMKFADLAHEKLVIEYNRPEELSNDTASLDDLLVYYQQGNPDIDIWCLLQPTSPLRTLQDIKDAFAMMLEKETTGDDYKYDSLVSVYNHPVLAWINNSVGIPGVEEPQAIATYRYKKRPNRQDRKDWYLENGAIYFTRKYVIEQTKCRLHGFIGLYVMPMERSFEIDNQVEWDICEMLMEKRNG